MFGGFGFDAAGVQGDLNDLWQFDVTTNQWTWMGGSNEVPGNYQGQPGNYGILGSPETSNIPSGRYAAAHWMDNQGNLWLFGGMRYDSTTSFAELNDLWMFNPSKLEWTWMGGSSTDVAAPGGYPGTYGTRDQPAPANYPGARRNAMSWVDTKGNLWMFGGYGIDSVGTEGLLNDLWMFNPSTNQWTWISGVETLPPNSAPLPGLYGTLQQAAAGNAPGGRGESVSWVDTKGDLWLFGGRGYDAAGNLGWLNDLWMFNPSNNEWEWMGGASTLAESENDFYGEPGVYGDLGTPDAKNWPGSREEATSWTDSQGNLWLFGGYGFDAAYNFGFLNDLWRFDPTINQWTWVAGTNDIAPSLVDPGVYGALGVGELGDTPGGREGGASWTDNQGNFWLFGGIGYDAAGNLVYLNDLWRFGLATNGLPVAATPTISPTSGTYTTMQSVTITDSTPGVTIFYLVNGVAPPTEYTGPITVTSSETIEAIAEGSGYANSAVSTATYTVKLPVAATPVFSVMPGSYASPQRVMISDATPGAVIYYTTSGNPTTGSAVYKGPITVSTSDTVQAIAVANGYAESAIGSASYVIAPTSALGEWEWVNGGSTVPQCGNSSTPCGNPGVYGALGASAIGNLPGGREFAASWTDQGGKLWLFGGEGSDSAGVFGLLNDLWKFDPTLGEWTWEGGTSTFGPTLGSSGVYGTQGSADQKNMPGSRYLASTWTDTAGNFWLFGGFGLDSAGVSGTLDDLWQFNPSTMLWTWIGGPSAFAAGCLKSDTCVQAGVYGTLGTPSADNIPGGREAAVTWTDAAGNFWLFGGNGTDSVGNSGMLNDLWEFSPSTGLWSWIAGSNTLVPMTGPTVWYGEWAVYGQLGVPAPGNVPGGREGGSGWVDASGNLWTMGGWGYDQHGFYGFLNDMWEFNIQTRDWTWMGGFAGASSEGSALPVYGAEGTPGAANMPSIREFASASTDRSTDTFWLFGGFGADSNVLVGNVNDLWNFNPKTNQWTWTSGGPGTSPIGVYGVQGAPSPTNVPSNREGAAGWIDLAGNLWFFAGNVSGLSLANDLWEYIPPENVARLLTPAATPSFSIQGGTYSSQQSVSIADTTAGAVIYYTTDRSNPTTSSSVYNGAVTVSTSETIEAIAVASGHSTSAVASATYTINLPPPSFTLAASPGSLTVQSGSSSATALTVTPQNGFNSTVSFACSGLPTGASCAFSPTTVTPAGSAVTTTLTITVPTQSAAISTSSRLGMPAAAVLIAGCLVGWKRRRNMQLWLALAIAAVGIGVLASCGGVSSGAGGGGGSMPVISTVTVTATSQSLQQTTSISLTVN